MTQLKEFSKASSESEKSLSTTITNLLDDVGNSYDETELELFCDALQDIAVFSYLAQNNMDLKKVNDRLAKQLCSTIFNLKTTPYEALLTSKGAKESLQTPNKYLMEFFKMLQQLSQKQDYVIDNVSGSLAAGALMKRIMCEVLDQNRSDLEPLKILSLLCAICGLDIPLLITADSCCNNIFKTHPSPPILTILSNLLEACSLHPQYFNAGNIPENYLKPSDWLEGFCSTLLDLKQIPNKSARLKCFNLLLKISVPVIENNIVSIVRTCLFDIKVDSAQCKEEYCSFFHNLISLYSRLHQLPKLFVKLLLSLAECVQESTGEGCLSTGQIYPSVLMSMASGFEGLHFGQIIELWKIFSETYTTFGNMSELFAYGRGAVFFLAQIFSTFLMHSKLFDPSIPSDVYDKFGELIQHTTKELKNNLSVLLQNTEEIQLLEQAFLTLCHTLGEIKLIYNYHDEQTIADVLSLKEFNNPFDCSLLFNFFSEQHTRKFEVLLNGKNNVLSLEVLELLILKIKALMHLQELSEAESNHLKLSISCVVKHAEENLSSGASWNLDLSSLSDENYGTAVWRNFLKLLPLILNSMDTKELLKVCGCFREIVLLECSSSVDFEGTDLKTLILSSLKNPYFQESKPFQTALTASIWRLDDHLLRKKRLSDECDMEANMLNVLLQLGHFQSKYMKFIESTPKMKQGEELNGLWRNLKEMCSALDKILQLDAICRPKIKSKVFTILPLLDCCPLEYLLPCNQVRCVVGLSTLFFLIPESCKANEVHKISEQVSTQLIAMFEGVRSIWFFDFMTSGCYLREVVNTIEKLVEKMQSESIPSFLVLLLDHIVGIISKNSESLLAAEAYFSEVVKTDKYSQVSILTLNLILKKLAKVFHRVHIQPHYKEVSEKIASSACSVCTRALKKYDLKGIDSTFSLLIQCYVEVIEILVAPACEIEQKKRDRYLSQIPNILQIAKESIQDSSENHDVVFKFFACICKRKQMISSFVPEGLFSNIWNTIYTDIQQRHTKSLSLLKEVPLTADNSFSDNELELLQFLLPLLSAEETVDIFNQFFKQMKNWDLSVVNPLALEINLNFVKQIVECDSESRDVSLIAPSLLNLLTHLCFLVSQTNNSDSHLSMVKIPVLQFINFLVKQQKSYIHNDQWLYCLQPCVMNLECYSNNLPLFVKAFDALWNILYNLLTCHPEVILKTITVFMMLLTNLVRALVVAGAQDAVYATDKDTQNKLFLAAQNMDKLMSVVARYKTEFAKHVAFLIADYANCVQHVTLETNIKHHLILGFNRLLDLCNEHSIQMTSVNINHSCREIFSNIVKNYNQSRYRGDV